MSPKLSVVETPEELARILNEASAARRLGMDIESNGLFVYRPRICTVQLVWESQEDLRIAVVDGLTAGIEALRAILQAPSPIKVVHDVAFDARLLKKEGISLATVHDTALAATFLGRPATGLEALLRGELGIEVDKGMQRSNWARRPLDAEAFSYLAADVEHLLALDDVLWAAVTQTGIEDEVLTETRYRLGTAVAPDPPRLPAFLRIRGLDRLDDVARAVLKETAEQREQLAEQTDVPAFKIATDQVLVTLATRRPGSIEALQGAVGTRTLDEPTARTLLGGVRRGVAAGKLDAEHEAMLHGPRMDRAIVEQRRRREKRLSAWREAEAARRGVHAQVVLPGHCLRRLAGGESSTAEQIAALDGIGSSRAVRYAGVLAEMLAEARTP